MRWKGRRVSSNIEDRRGSRPVRRAGGLGIGGILMVLIISYFTGQNPLQLFGALGGGGGGRAAVGVGTPTGGGSVGGTPQDELGQFAGVVLADTEETWATLFQQQVGRRYQAPVLVLFSEAVQSACGYNSAAVGPFYCPGDNKVYIDLTFFREMERRLGAPGDFAQAYVIAHEVGHHVQNLLGISTQVHQRRQQMSRTEGNQLAVRLELQADCLAGVWAHHAHNQRQLLEPGDVEEGLNAASAIGDDTLQRRAGGRVQPESWTHGSSDQRMRWLRQGLESGNIETCDTFATQRL